MFSGPFAEVYVGGAVTETTDLREKFTGGLVGARKFKDVEFNTSDIEAQNVVTTGFGAGPLRYPGLFLDVVGAGPTFFIAHIRF